MEIEDDDEVVYYRKIKTELKSKTVFSDKPHYVIIDKIDVIDGGLFSGKSISFEI